MQKIHYQAKINKTTDNKKLVSGQKKSYDYGTINLRKPELAKYIGKQADITITIEE